MEKSATPMRWNPLVCIEHSCSCEERMACGGQIPDGCPYKILHLVDARKVGFHERPRRSGKTTELVSLANDLARTTGKPVYFVAPMLEMVERVKRLFVVDKKVKFVSVGQVRNGWMRGQPYGFVVMDEVGPAEQDEMKAEMSRHEAVAGLWTD